MVIYTWDSDGEVILIVFFVYADQGEFDNIMNYLDSNKTYTRNIIYPECFGIFS